MPVFIPIITSHHSIGAASGSVDDLGKLIIAYYIVISVILLIPVLFNIIFRGYKVKDALLCKSDQIEHLMASVLMGVFYLVHLVAVTIIAVDLLAKHL